MTNVANVSRLVSLREQYIFHKFSGEKVRVDCHIFRRCDCLPATACLPPPACHCLLVTACLLLPHLPKVLLPAHYCLPATACLPPRLCQVATLFSGRAGDVKPTRVSGSSVCAGVAGQGRMYPWGGRCLTGPASGCDC